MWHVEKNFTIIIGGNTYIDVPNLVAYRGKPLFKIERRESDGLLGVSFDIYNQKRKKVATIRKNRIVQGNGDDYKFIREANRYAVIEKKSNRSICNILKRTDAAPAELNVSVEFYIPDGFLFNATPEETNLPGTTLKGVIIKNCSIGINIE